MASEQEDFALLLQEAMEDFKTQQQQNSVLLQEHKNIAEKLTQLLALQSGSTSTISHQQRTRVEVSLQTRNRVHSVYGNLQEKNEGWDFTLRFTSPGNQTVVGKLCQEIKSTHPGTSESEITEACKVYFKSLKDDKNRRDKGKHDIHRRSLKLARRIKQKLQRRKKVLEEASPELHWSATFKSRVKSLLAEDYMSSETSAEESDSENIVGTFKVRKLRWLKRRYRKAFHELDTVHRNKQSKRSKGMTRPRVPSKHLSRRPIPSNIPSWATSEQATAPDSPLNASSSSLSSSADNI